MKQWYAKEFSRLTQVSVRTLHHYDKIGLLKPSLRLSNRYRLYSEQDLSKLQQIIALKFFGFELAQIKRLLAHNANILENRGMQAKFLQEKARNTPASEAKVTIYDVLIHDEQVSKEAKEWLKKISNSSSYSTTSISSQICLLFFSLAKRN